MQKLMRLSEIRQLPVGSIKWKSAISKYVSMTLTPNQDDEFKKTGTLIVPYMAYYCIDEKNYRCFVKLVDNVSVDQYDVTYEEIP